MRVATLNVNGIRSATEKGLLEWLRRSDLDVVCLQELRATIADLPRRLRAPRGYHVHYVEAEKKGYSGVAIWSRRPPERVTVGFGWPEVDVEARIVRFDLPGLAVHSVYVPSGSSGEVRQAFKMRFLERFLGFLAGLPGEGREHLLAGDLNVAHRPIDLKNWRSNQKNSGFLPEERAILDRVFGEVGFVDAFRVKNQAPEQYTWWSNRGQAYAKNVGWRLDYQLVTPGLASRIEAVSIYTGRRFSDHAPLIVDYAD